MLHFVDHCLFLLVDVDHCLFLGPQQAAFFITPVVWPPLLYYNSEIWNIPSLNVNLRHLKLCENSAVCLIAHRFSSLCYRMYAIYRVIWQQALKREQVL